MSAPFGLPLCIVKKLICKRDTRCRRDGGYVSVRYNRREWSLTKTHGPPQSTFVTRCPLQANGWKRLTDALRQKALESRLGSQPVRFFFFFPCDGASCSTRPRTLFLSNHSPPPFSLNLDTKTLLFLLSPKQQLPLLHHIRWFISSFLAIIATRKFLPAFLTRKLSSLA
jgi:hypothetical protein